MRIWAALFAVLATPLSADEAAIEQAWRGWVAENGVRESTLAILKDGEVVGTFGSGVHADTPVPLASLSKSITAACIMSMIDDGLMGYDTNLGTLLADRPDVLGNGADITIDQLLTHTSGLDVDLTQSLLNPTLWGAVDMHGQFSQTALQRPVGPPEFFYNNENYAVLGVVIAEVTGQSVQQACGDRVLADLDSAAPHRLTGGGLAWGGWAMSVADFAGFAAALKVTDDWPRAPLGGRAYYGPGVLMRDTPTGVNLWHFGGYCVVEPLNHGSYFNILDNGWGVVVSYNICANDEQARALDNALASAQYAQ